MLLPKDYLRLRHHPGDTSITLGTSAVVLGVADHPVPGSFCHAQRDQWLRLDSLHAGGKSLEWLRDLLAPGESLMTLTASAADVPPGAHGLHFLPFLMGSGVPEEVERLAPSSGSPPSTDVATWSAPSSKESPSNCAGCWRVETPTPDQSR